MRDPFAQDPEFSRLLRGDEGADLALVSLEIARDLDRSLDPASALARIDRLADRIRDRCPPSAGARFVIGQINWVLFVEEEFRGNTEDYYDPRNSDLGQVLARKTGIPISLSILYAALAARVGLELGGVNLPMHFVLRAVREEPALFIDPFHDGAMLDRPGCEELLSRLSGQPVRLTFEHFTPCNASTVVIRLLRNLKAIHLRREDFGSALPVVRRLAALSRRDPIDQRDWGMVCLQADRPGEALEPLRRYLADVPGATDRDHVLGLIKSSLREIAFRN